MNPEMKLNNMHIYSFPFLLLISVLTVCLSQTACADTSFGNTRINSDQKVSDQLIVKILNNAEVTDLNKLDKNNSASLALKLYRIPVSGDCVAETHTTCAYDYYLAVSEFDEQPLQSVFHLGAVGGINKINWHKKDEVDQATLSIRVSNYPIAVFKQNPELETVTKDYVMHINTTGIRLNDAKLSKQPAN